MKIFVLVVVFFLSWTWGVAQEIPAVEERSEFLIQRLEIRPSLTNLAPEVPNTGKFRIREVIWDRDNERKEIDIAAYMEQEQRMKRRTLELAPPVQVPQVANNVSVNREEGFSLTPRFFNQSFSPEAYTRGTRNSVYRSAAETTGASYLNSYYNPFIRGRAYSPYSSRGYYYY